MGAPFCPHIGSVCAWRRGRKGGVPLPSAPLPLPFLSLCPPSLLFTVPWMIRGTAQGDRVLPVTTFLGSEMQSQPNDWWMGF